MTPTTSASGMPLSTLRLLLVCGIIGPLFFIIVFLIAGATRADYNPLRHPVSSLSIGHLGWMQAANFVISGALILTFAIGLRGVLLRFGPARWEPLLIGLVGVGLIGAGLFVADPLNGYPPGTLLVPADRSIPGRLHDLFSLPVFLALPAAAFVSGRRFARMGERRWSAYSVVTGIAMFITFILAGVGFRQVVPAFAEVAGLMQRVSIIIGFAWIALLALWLVRQQPQRG